MRKSTLPSSPNDYKAELPADFKMPEGITYEFRTDDPYLHQARELFHNIDQGKVSGQEAFSKALALFAGNQVASAQERITRRNNELAQLGPNGPARIDALVTFYRAYLGTEAGNRAVSHIWTAQDVKDHEVLVGKITAQGGASFRGNGREPPTPQGRLSDDQIARLTPAQRLDYSRQFDQSTMPAWRDPRGG